MRSLKDGFCSEQLDPGDFEALAQLLKQLDLRMTPGDQVSDRARQERDDAVRPPEVLVHTEARHAPRHGVLGLS